MTTTKKTEKPKLDLSPLEWRLVLIAALAIGYVAAWFGLETRPASTTPAALPEWTPPPSATWLEEVPAPKRPSFSVPAGWTVASERPRPAPVLRATDAPRRIRTRSS